jgi:cytosine deaminase
MPDWILRGCRLAGREGLPDLGIAGGAVTAVAPGERGLRELALDGRLVLPGLVNAHVRLAGTGGAFEGRVAVLLERCARRGTTALRLTVEMDAEEPLRPLRLAARARVQHAAAIDVQLALDVTAAATAGGARLAALVPHTVRAGADALHVRVDGATPSPALPELARMAEDSGLGLDVVADAALPPARIGAGDLALPRVLALLAGRPVARRTRILHATALAAVHRDDLAPVLRDLAAAALPLVVCPVAALRSEASPPPAHARRGIPRLGEILEAGILLALGTGTMSADAVRGPGDGVGATAAGGGARPEREPDVGRFTVALDPLALAWLAGYAAHLGVPPALERLRPAVTTAAAASLGLDSPLLDSEPRASEPGHPRPDPISRFATVLGPADLVVLDAPTFARAVVDHARPLHVFKGGRPVPVGAGEDLRATSPVPPAARAEVGAREILVIREAALPRRPGRHDVVIVDGIIREIGGGAAPAGAAEISAAGRLLVPAFVDAHLHVDKTFVMDRVAFPGRNLTVAEAVAAMARVKAGFSHDDLIARGRETLRRALRHGTTAIRAQCDVDPIIGLAGLEALVELRREFAPLLDLQIVAFPQEGLAGDPHAVALMRQALARGADAVGGGPLDPDYRAHIEQAFALAREAGAAVDIHADLGIDGLRPTAEWESVLIASLARAGGLAGRTAIGHFAASSALDAAALRPLADALAEAGVSVASLTASEMYRQGMADLANSRRGVARVRDLLAAGVNVVFASNNVRDAFVTFGNADMLEQALLGALGAGLDGDEGLAEALDMVTSRPATLMGLRHRRAVEVGQQADLVLLDAHTAAEAIVDQAARLVVLRRGQIIERGGLASPMSCASGA